MNKIKVLFAPANTANMPDITMQALNELPGIEARGISFGNSKYWNFGKGWIVYDIPSRLRTPIKTLITLLSFRIQLFKLIAWADVLMWHWDMTWFTALYIKLLGKKVFVEWIGSDIRLPEYLFIHNPYYKMAWENGEWNYTKENATRSRRIQRKFKFINAQPILCPEISLFLNKKYFHTSILYYQRIDLHNYKVAYPSPANNLPVLVHTPSATGAKGTKYVREVIERLKAAKFEFDYVEIHNQTRQQAIDAIASCDIFIDQFIVGSYGLATCEAMAMGKPVLCYLMPVAKEILPQDIAIVDTNIDNLESTLRKYISDAQLRYETGIKSRQYVEKYHDAAKIALQLETLFKKELNSN